MESAFFGHASSHRIVVKRTFIEEVNSPREEPEGLRVRASSDSALYEKGEEERRREREQMESKVDAEEGEVEFEMDGLSEAETTSDPSDLGRAAETLPCYSHLPEAPAPTTPGLTEAAQSSATHAAGCVQKPPSGAGYCVPMHADFSSKMEIQARSAASSAAAAAPWAAAAPAAAAAPRGAPAATASSAGAAPAVASPAAASSSGARRPTQNQPVDLEHLLRENQRLALENHMLRGYCFPMPVREGGGAPALQGAPCGAHVARARAPAPGSQQAIHSLVVAAPGVARAEAPELGEGAASSAKRVAKGAAKAVVTGKGAARGSAQPESAGSTAEVTAVPEHLRTTVMLRNLPNNYSRAMLLDLLDQEGFAAKYDFLYLPIDFKSGACLGYAFVNLINPGVVPSFWRIFEGFSKWILPSKKVCHVSWSGPHQGLEDHIERYRNSPIMHPTVVDECKPLIFRDGVRVAFPEPTKSTRAPRIRNKTSAASSSADASRGQ